MVFITSPPMVLLWVVVVLLIIALVSRLPSSRRGVRVAVGFALLFVGLGEIAFAAEDGNFAQAHSYSFLFPSVAPGAHQVFLEYRSQVNGEAVNIDRFAVEVRHR